MELNSGGEFVSSEFFYFIRTKLVLNKSVSLHIDKQNKEFLLNWNIFSNYL
jgi:hypothetical protein